MNIVIENISIKYLEKVVINKINSLLLITLLYFIFKSYNNIFNQIFYSYLFSTVGNVV